VTTIRRLRNDPRVPRRAKIAVLLAGVWVASPIDLIPEFLPVIGRWTTSSWSPSRRATPRDRCPATSSWPPGPASPGCWNGCSVSPRHPRPTLKNHGHHDDPVAHQIPWVIGRGRSGGGILAFEDLAGRGDATDAVACV
jgi:Protein of unknown function (DUF1232)